MKKLTILYACFLFPLFSQGQQEKYSQDVTSIDAIIHAIYDVISGPADQPRDWERFRFLFADDAKLIPTKKQDNGQVTYRYWSPGDYVKMFTANRTAFFERELNRVTEEYGNIVHVFSTYETKTDPGGPVTNRGINSFQLLKDDDRYYIMTIFWSAESDGFELPGKYLQKN